MENYDVKIKEENKDDDSRENVIDQNIDDEEQEEGQILRENNRNIIEDKKEDNEEDEDGSSELDIDEDRLTLVQVREFLRKKRLRKNKKNSLLQKKEKNGENITYDSNTKSLRNCFCPDSTELEEFLKNCEVKQIFDLDDNNPQTKNIFDPREFMKSNNIEKMSLSVEDLSLYTKDAERINYPSVMYEVKKELIKPIMTEFEFTSTSIYKSKDKEYREKAKEQFAKIRKIMSEKVLSQEQKNWLSEFINYVSKLPLNEIIDKNKKFEIVFDLDNTCMFSYIGDKEEVKEAINRYPEKEMKIFTFEHLGKMIVSALIIRKGLKEFVEYVKDLCNFHISTLSVPNYGRETARLLENTLGIQFKKFKSRTELNKCKKYMNDLNDNNEDNTFSAETVIIFDDSVSVWENDSFNVIASKKFFDKELKNRNDRDRLNDDLSKFLNSYIPFSYNKIKEENSENYSWKSQTIITKSQCPFYQYKYEDTPSYNESYFGEYLSSPKFQFNYMKNVIKVIYCLVFHNDVCISEAIKLVRLNALNGKAFLLKYLTDEQKSILKDIIKVCGGEVCNDENNDSITFKTKKIFLVASKKQFELMKNIILSECNRHPNYILINERFILDSYYFMTDLGENYRDNEYSFYDGV